jgi:hypothetical protein
MEMTVALTPAELEMIKVKREQDALAKKEAELIKQAQFEKVVSAKRAYMDKQKLYDNEQIQATKDFANSLGTDYTLKIKTWVEEVYIKEYDENNQYVPVWTDNFTRRSAYIVNGDYTINVTKHITYGSKYFFGGTDNGFKMFVSGPGIEYKYEKKALSNTKTVSAKIDACIEARRYELEYKQKQLTAVEVAVNKMEILYPDALVTHTKDSERSYNGKYETYDAVTIKFTNGINIKYKVYADGSLGRKDITFNVKDAWALMDVMNAVTISESHKTNQ